MAQSGRLNNNDIKLIGNILWLVLGGILISFYYAVVGLIFCLTIIGISFGKEIKG